MATVSTKISELWSKVDQVAVLTQGVPWPNCVWIRGAVLNLSHSQLFFEKINKMAIPHGLAKVTSNLLTWHRGMPMSHQHWSTADVTLCRTGSRNSFQIQMKPERNLHYRFWHFFVLKFTTGNVITCSPSSSGPTHQISESKERFWRYERVIF